MDNYKGYRTVVQAKLKQLDLVVPGVGTLGVILPPPSKTFKEFKMFYNASNGQSSPLFIVVNGREIVIGESNIQGLVLAPEESNKS